MSDDRTREADWARLARLTPARIGLGRAGSGLPPCVPGRRMRGYCTGATPCTLLR